MKTLILLGKVWYNSFTKNIAFRNLRLQGHYEGALYFSKKINNVSIVRKNHKTKLESFIKQNTNENILIIYCGHGSIGKWCIGSLTITKDFLSNIINLVDIKYNITIVSDSCFSDSMNIVDSRKNTFFISAAREVGKNEHVSAFFTVDGGYLSDIFYKVYKEEIEFSALKDSILQNYLILENESNEHIPYFFINN